jgi:hypothetical protein
MDSKLYLGELVITVEFNVKNGEFMFYVGNEYDQRTTNSKCLYDALSDYGIDYSRAKEIAIKCDKLFTSGFRVKLYKGDFYKPAPTKFRKATKSDE